MQDAQEQPRTFAQDPGILAAVKLNSFTIRSLRSHTRLQQLLGVILFIGFVVLVERYFGWTRLLAPWQTLSTGQIFAAVGLAFVSYWTRAMRLYDYFRPPRMAKVPETQEQLSGRQDMQGTFSVCLKITLQHNLLNNLLPMRAGEISFPVLMMRHFDMPMTRSVPALFWFRLLDLHTLGACALIATLGLTLNASLGITLLLAWMTLPLLLFWGQGRWQHALAVPALPCTAQEKPAAGRLRGLLQKILGSLPQTPGDFWRAWAWTVITWAIKLGVFAWVLMLFVNITPTAALMGAMAGDLTSVLPVHGIAGVGTYEAGVVAGLLPYGIALQNAVPAAVNLHLFLLASTLIGGGISLFLGNGKKPRG